MRCLPPGMTVARSLCELDGRTITTQVSNTGTKDVYLCPRTPIAEICSVEPPLNNADVVQVSSEEINMEEISGGPEQVQLIQQTVHDLMGKWILLMTCRILN